MTRLPRDHLSTRQLIHLALLPAILCLALPLFFFGAAKQSGVNRTDRKWRTDQDAYVLFAIAMKKSEFSYMGDRNRMPAYPFLQSLFYEEGMSRAAFFERGKQLNAILALVVLAAGFVVFKMHMSSLAAGTAIAIAAFSVFVYKAPYFQAEICYYGLFFGLFVLLLKIARRPTWKLGLAAGSVAALTHLTKASAIPAVFLGLLCIALHAVMDLRTALRSKKKGAAQWRPAVKTLVAGALFALAFTGVLFPYLNQNKQIFGRYFYNVNSNFYIWYDSWSEVKQGTRAHGDRTGWPNLPPEEIPSASRYFQTHTTQQIWDRIARGSRQHFKNVTARYRIGWYVGAYLLVLLGVVLVNRRMVFAGFCAPHRWVPVFFCGAFFFGYWVLYSFYASITSGARFPLALTLPALFVLARETSASQLDRYLWLDRAQGVTTARVGRTISIGLCCALLAGLSGEILFEFFSRVGAVYGGM